MSARLLLTAAAVAVMLAFAAYRWTERMLWTPLGTGGDMLLVVHAAMRRLLHGGDPYALYHVPWEAPLPYGPMLWGPFLIAQVQRIDLRVVTVAGSLFVPLWCGVAACVEASRGRVAAASAWLVLLAALALHPAFLRFMPTGHTAAYWPLLLLFAAFVAAEHWTAAGLVLGLLLAARSTMVVMVPIFAMAVWMRDRRAVWPSLASGALVTAVLLLPFVVWNPSTWWYGMVASYPKIMKEVVWTGPEHGLAATIGLTGWLVPHGFGVLVMPVNVIALLIVYVLACRALAGGARSLPWMALALFVFSMTTLWPVYYIYLDVFLLLASAAVVDVLEPNAERRIIAGWIASLAAVAVFALISVRVLAASRPIMVFDSHVNRQALSDGFAPFNVASPYAWVWGQTASVIVPRGATTDADIEITLQPVIDATGPPQQIVAILNGVLLGSTDARPGWQSVRFRAPAVAWQFGSNTLELRCASSARPIDVGLGEDPRHMSLAVRAIAVQ